ncbi:uncharacterized protein LOC112051015 [Bicyclus anynana]|uniref:Uncharacterized protein LOC112051015 n=1 Tax=Bicyclus anynana TaxID=110368 RepID=A0A6J1NJR7_BICAN|nr:uncharacterized protein LOC112051015 [Bicyclus anynana]
MRSTCGKNITWSEDEVIKFLKIYRKFDVLWDTSNVCYKSKQRQLEACKTFLKCLNKEYVTVRDLKKKMNSIRTNYTKELYKMAKDEYYTPRIFWFKLVDSFLRPVVNQRLNLTLKDQENSSPESETEDDNNFLKVTFIEENKKSSQTSRKIFKKKLKRYNNSTNFTPCKVERRSSKSSDSDFEDEFDHFSRSLAIQLRKLPEIDALDLMQQIQQIILIKKQQQQQTHHLELI